MKSINNRLLARLFGTLLILAVTHPATAQTQPALGVELYAGLSITGAVGRVYGIEYTTDIAQTNSWGLLTWLQLPTTNFLWADTTGPAKARRFYRAVQQDAPTNMVFIPPNTFKQGSQTNEANTQPDERPQMAVTITRGFWIGKYEVTQREFLDVQGTNPSSITGDLNRPVESVSWIEATNFCAKLTERELAAGRIPTGSQYRLPTEAEWEYAARAWTSTTFHYGDDPEAAKLANYAWYGDNSGFMSHPAGQKLPNPWGLYDMTGNVWEWCQDWYGTYPGGFQTNPKGPAASTGTGLGSYKVMRGGGFDYFAYDCRSARRLIFAPNLTDYDLGFRVVLATITP